MKKLVYSAAALTLVGSAFASDSEWSAFDQDVNALTTSLAVEKDGPNIGGYLQTLYTNNSDATPKESGFDILRARIGVSGGREGYTYKVLYQVSDNTLRDAYFTIPVSSVSARFGRFKPGVSRNGLTSSSRLFFINRSAIGDSFDGRQDGLGINGEFDQLAWWLSLTDGADTMGDNDDEYLIALRVSLDLMGDGVGSVEGAFGGSDEISAEASLSFFDDGGVTDGDGIIFEAHAVSSVYSFGIEFADLSMGGPGAATSGTILGADSSPFALYGTYMLTPDQWEVGLRFQDLDRADDTNIIEIGVNHYLDGHNLKWGFGYSTVSSDTASLEQDVLQVLLSMRF